MIEEYLVPVPRNISLSGESISRPTSICLEVLIQGPAVERDAARLAGDLLDIAGIPAQIGGHGFKVRMEINEGLHSEGYRLKIDRDSISLAGADPAGLFYAGQTLLQILTLGGADLELLEITDWPQYKTRELMVDMGRGVYSMRLLKRVVRIMGRLKLNTLHMHLFDDQLNSLRFKNMPLGNENPWAITVDDLGQLVAYARQHHVSIMPEIEAWGHANSILHHYPELYGAPGMWEGFSFGIGEELFDLIGKMLDEILPVMEEDCTVHLGLDEANWALLPSAKSAPEGTYTPEKLVGRLYDVLQNAGARHGRRPRMRIWADHGGRPVPQNIRDQVITEPWQYFEYQVEDIKQKIAKFGGNGKPPFMMGGGMSSQHLQGTYGATRIWCREGMDTPNAEGIDICMWESNDVAGHMVGIYAGASYAWWPMSLDPQTEDTLGERVRGLILRKMKRWQNTFTDAAESKIRLDMGEEVYRGFYVTGPLAGKPVAPTALLEQPRTEESLTM